MKVYQTAYGHIMKNWDTVKNDLHTQEVLWVAGKYSEAVYYFAQIMLLALPLPASEIDLFLQ